MATKTAQAEKLQEIREERQALQEKLQIEQLRSDIKAAEGESRWLGEAFGDLVNRNEALYDGGGLSRFAELDPATAIARPDDRARGDNWPLWRTETEHAQIRGVCRLIANLDEVAISALENLTNYCVGEGLSYTVVPKAKQPTAEQKRIAAIAQDALERFLDANDIERDTDREDFTRLHRDGETGVGLFDGSGGIPDAVSIDPSFLVEPDRPRALEDYAGEGEALSWKYGVATTFRDTSKHRHAFICWHGDDLECDTLPAERFVWTTVNVDREVKRGLSDLFAVWQKLRNAGKLLDNTIQGAAIQAAIAYIREHATGTRNDQVSRFVSASGSPRMVRKPGSSSERERIYERNARPGRVIDSPQGGKIHAGPLGQLRQAGYVEVVQAALRLVGVRFQQPEYMISGDASNGNYASTLVAEAPFTKSSEAKQGRFTAARRALCLRALAIMCRTGIVPIPFVELLRVVDVVVEGPEVAVRDLLESHTIRRDEWMDGIRSTESYAEDAGLDYEEEQRRGLRPADTIPSEAPSFLAPADDLPAESTAAPSPASGPPPEPASSPVDSEAKAEEAETQNAARVAYPLIALITGIGNGVIARDAGLAQLQTVFGFSAAEAAALIGSTAPPEDDDSDDIPTPATVSEAWQSYP